MKNYVLDACAVIAFIIDEEGAEKVEKILARSSEKKCAVYINKINLLEIYYNFRKEYDQETLDEAYSRILALPISVVDTMNDDVFYEAGRLKSEYKISLADAIALAEAKTRGALLVTCDHHEFDAIDKSEEVRFHWIR